MQDGVLAFVQTHTGGHKGHRGLRFCQQQESCSLGHFPKGGHARDSGPSVQTRVKVRRRHPTHTFLPSGRVLAVQG